jgi:hypothetical protein
LAQKTASQGDGGDATVCKNDLLNGSSQQIAFLLESEFAETGERAYHSRRQAFGI